MNLILKINGAYLLSIRVSYELENLTPVIKVEGSGLRAMHRKAENTEIFCMFRETGVDGDYQIHLPTSKGYLLDLENGKLQHLQTENGVLKLSLQIGETVVLLLTEENLNTQNKKEFKDEPFLFSQETELICNENCFENVKHSDKAIPITLGNWSYLIVSAYSGSGVYETTFTLPDEKLGKEGEINLGGVHFVASVYLNDQFLGTSLTAPYNFKIPDNLLRKENKLKIVVTNTSANWYIHTDYFNKWNTEELSTYFDGEKEFAKDFVSGGLYGPVVLYTE